MLCDALSGIHIACHTMSHVSCVSHKEACMLYGAQSGMHAVCRIKWHACCLAHKVCVCCVPQKVACVSLAAQNGTCIVSCTRWHTCILCHLSVVIGVTDGSLAHTALFCYICQLHVALAMILTGCFVFVNVEYEFHTWMCVFLINEPLFAVLYI